MTKSVKSLMIVSHLLVSVLTPKVVGMISNSMPTCLLSVLALLFQPALVFFACKGGTFLVMFMNFFNQQATKKGGNNQVAAFSFYPALQSLNIHALGQSPVYHFLFLCQHFGGVYGCNIIEYIKSSEIA